MMPASMHLWVFQIYVHISNISLMVRENKCEETGTFHIVSKTCNNDSIGQVRLLMVCRGQLADLRSRINIFTTWSLLHIQLIYDVVKVFEECNLLKNIIVYNKN